MLMAILDFGENSAVSVPLLYLGRGAAVGGSGRTKRGEMLTTMLMAILAFDHYVDGDP